MTCGCSCQSTQVAPVPPAPLSAQDPGSNTLPSWYYSDPGGHTRRGGARSHGQAGQDSDLRSAGLASTISCPAPGDTQEAQSWNAGPSELRKRPEGIPLIFPKKAAGAQRDEETCPESHNCLEM